MKLKNMWDEPIVNSTQFVSEIFRFFDIFYDCNWLLVVTWIFFLYKLQVTALAN